MSSKLRKLKQQALEAARKRDWAGAADAYAQILEHDRNNPSLLNEYGDMCLKSGDVVKALRQYLSAASKYRQTGLLNNAQAVYKKVLRHEPNNINANWYLAEIRSAQGLLAEGARHALVFLSAAEEVSGEIKEIFLKRCLELFALYPDNDRVLERIEGIFRIWKMPLETARAACLRACLAYSDDAPEAASAAVASLVESVPELTNYAEYTRWQERIGQKSPARSFSDVNAIDLQARPDAGGFDAAADHAPEQPVDDRRDFSSFGELEASGARQTAPVAGAPAGGGAGDQAPDLDVDRDEDGCISIDTDDKANLDDVVQEAARCLARLDTSTDVARPDRDGAPAGTGDPSENLDPDASRHSSGTVNLLNEILAEEGQDIVRSNANEQVSTIASEIGRNLAEAEDLDPEMLYQQGMVYLEMGLNDQAAVAFSKAAREQSHRLAACEMWAIALQRSGQAEAALQVLEDGLASSDSSGRQALGLRYHAGRILEQLGRMDEAQEHYRLVHSCDAGFADVIRRLRVQTNLGTTR